MRVLGRFPEEVTLDRCLASDEEGGTKTGTSSSNDRKADVANSSREDSGLENENLAFFFFWPKILESAHSLYSLLGARLQLIT